MCYWSLICKCCCHWNILGLWLNFLLQIQVVSFIQKLRRNTTLNCNFWCHITWHHIHFIFCLMCANDDHFIWIASRLQIWSEIERTYYIIIYVDLAFELFYINWASWFSSLSILDKMEIVKYICNHLQNMWNEKMRWKSLMIM